MCFFLDEQARLKAEKEKKAREDQEMREAEEKRFNSSYFLHSSVARTKWGGGGVINTV